MVKHLTTVFIVSLGLLTLSIGQLQGGEFIDAYGRIRSACDVVDTPPSIDRVCRLHYDSENSQVALQWYTGTLNVERCDDNDNNNGVLPFCPGYVGMRMSLWCDFSDNSTSLYKNGSRIGGSTVTFYRLQKEDEGAYRCMRNGSLIGEFNMTVDDEIHIGGAYPFECRSISFHSYDQKNCCCIQWSPDVLNNRQKYPFSFAVYGDNPKLESMSTKWMTPSKYHYPTDVKVFYEVNDTLNIWTVNYQHDPSTVTSDREEGSSLEMTVRFTISNNFSNFSLCILIRFPGIYPVSTDISLPQNAATTVGGDATFVCQFGLSSKYEEILLRFELVLHDNSSLTTKCYFLDECEEWAATTNLSTGISIQLTNDLDLVYNYEISLTNIEENLNGSVFSCSISTRNSGPNPQEFIEWEGSAELVVNKESDVNRKVIASITVPVNLLVVFILFVVVLLVVMRVRKMKTHSSVFRKMEQNIDTVPLTDQSYLSIPQSTINSEVGTPVTEERQLPAISIIERGGAYRDLIVGEVLPESQSMDSGVSCTEDYDNSRKSQSYPHDQEHVSPRTLCRRETDIIDPERALSVPQTKLVIYISYTDSTSRWVRSTLKPLIDSWNIGEVMIPDRDMVAGKAISDERRRLIVEADKIILVISPDYYDSEWCSYELMHAIQSEPTLSRGRVIPIFIDGCQYLPQNMEVVVPLFAHELDFSSRLQTAVCQQHRLSQ